MTREPEILTLTLEEALRAIAEHQSDLWLECTPHGRWVVFQDAKDGYFTRSPYCETWPEAVSAALGRKIVARDEAAEVRALLREALEEIEAAVEAEYPLDLRRRYQHISLRYVRDMELPDRIRAALVDVGEQSLGSDR